MEKVSLQEIVTNVCLALQFQIKRKKIKVLIPKNLPTIISNEKNMNTVFSNLFENAINSLGKNNNPRIEIGWEDKDQFNVFWVKDNGMGVSEEMQERVFDLCQRGNTLNQIGGTGVRLSIVKYIVEKHGGLVRMSSKVGQGTTIYFALPKSSDPQALDGKAKVK